jgi:predicted O-linked N-acetylglucosamine transferase (SPINDLY family)
MSLDRFAPAEAALKAGKFEEGAAIIERLLAEEPKAPAIVYRNYAAMLVRRKLYVQAEIWTAKGLEIHPRDTDLMNLRGVALRRLGRPAEAIEVLARANRLAPKDRAILNNLGNVYNDTRSPAAIEVFTKLVRATPNDAEAQRSMGRALWFAGDLEKAEIRFKLATKLKPQLVDAWLDIIGLANDLHDPGTSNDLLAQALIANPADVRLIEAQAVAFRRAGEARRAEQILLDAIAAHPNQANLYFQLGNNITDYDRVRANEYLRKAVELAPDESRYRVSLAESLGRSRHGDEAANLEEAYGILKSVLPQMPLEAGNLKIAYELMTRVADYDGIDQMGSFSQIGRTWAEAGRHTALFAHLARVVTLEDRHELIEQHRIWGRKAEAAAARHPINRLGPRQPNGKIRVGFMSSDLRAHPVAYFALPLFEHYDRERFEVYCYSYYQGEEDGIQKSITGWVDAFRWRKDISDRDAAQMIADDQLDILFELGGTTHMNKLGVMAFKPAPLSASWVGYPHSAGLGVIDYLVVDPYLLPDDPALLIEKPMILPKAWYTMGPHAFREEPTAAAEPPVVRNGYTTFGTANNPYKYNRKVLQTWAQIVAQTPGSRFLFVRPEGNSPTFQANIRRIFAEQGVPADRVIFNAVRGRHLPFYNEMDISLDAFPQTGGTTTCEALWMGVPVIAKRGPAVFERLSYSVLENAGLGEFCAETVEGYVEAALRLAADPARIGELRRGMRGRLKASPLGDTKQFAADYFATIAQAVTADSPDYAGASSKPEAAIL